MVVSVCQCPMCGQKFTTKSKRAFRCSHCKHLWEINEKTLISRPWSPKQAQAFKEKMVAPEMPSMHGLLKRPVKTPEIKGPKKEDLLPAKEEPEPEKPMVDCPQCGNPIEEDTAVCPYCSSELEWSE